MDVIAQIKQNLPIKELCGWLGIEINKSGFAYSIYKKENTPSMMIYEDTDHFKCYSTSSPRGDVIDLYQHFYRIDKKDAIKELCEKLGLNRQDPSDFSIRERVENTKKKFSELMPDRFLKCLSDDERYIFDENIGRWYDCDSNTVIEADEGFMSRFNSIIAQAKREIQKFRYPTNVKIFTELYIYCNCLVLTVKYIN